MLFKYLMSNKGGINTRKFKVSRFFMKTHKRTVKHTILTCLEQAVGELDRAIFQQYNSKLSYKAEEIRSNNFSDKTVYCQNNIKIEIRSKEGKHHRPHFHVSVKEQSASIALDNLLDKVEVIAGELDKKYMKEVVKWAKENYALLMETWKQFHGSVVLVS